MTPQWSRFLGPVLSDALNPIIKALTSRQNTLGGRLQVSATATYRACDAATQAELRNPGEDRLMR